MNVAIQVTCLLIEAAETDIQLKVVGENLKVRSGSPVEDELRHRLREYHSAIVQRLNFNASHPDPFGPFITQHCLFFAGEGMATAITELYKAYRRWGKSNDGTVLPVALLRQRLIQLGCEEVFSEGAPWLEHVGIWWPSRKTLLTFEKGIDYV